MTEESRAGKVQTVLGAISPHELGVTVTHEHLLIDTLALFAPPAEAGMKELYYRPVSPEAEDLMETIGYVKHHGVYTAADWQVLDVLTAIDEISLYKQNGGDTIVDVTSVDIGRDPVGLARISRATGVNIVMGGSYYVYFAHPPDMDSRSEDDIAEEIVRDVTEGVDGTGIRSGIIGEVGCSWPLADNERKVLRASGRAQRLTGAPITIHPGRNPDAPFEIIEILTDVGVDISQVVMGHICRTFVESSDFKRLAETGCYIEWDLFGEERSYYYAQPTFSIPNDATRLDQIAWLIDQGYGERLLVAHDVGMNHRLAKYGGHGYFYIIAHVVPRMRARGFGQLAIDNLLVNNPQRALTFAEPRRT